MSTVKVDVHHVTRVEGHGNIVVDVENGEIKECRFDVVEAPRFFEAFVRGRLYSELSHITSRICGICSVGHSTASLEATEKALGVHLTEQATLLRKLLFHGEMLDSHVLHTYYLVAPDFLGVESVIPLVATHREVVVRALRVKKLAGDLCAMIGGRHTHPCALTVGGFTHTPTEQELRDMRARLVDARADMDATVDLFSTLYDLARELKGVVTGSVANEEVENNPDFIHVRELLEIYGPLVEGLYGKLKLSAVDPSIEAVELEINRLYLD